MDAMVVATRAKVHALTKTYWYLQENRVRARIVSAFKAPVCNEFGLLSYCI